MRRNPIGALFFAFLVMCAPFWGWGSAQAQPALGDFPALVRPWSTDADKFSFAILGDKTSGGEGKWPIYDRAVDAMNLLAPDFVVTVGDQIPGHMQNRDKWDAEWAEYMEHAKRIAAPVFFTVGNHDIANPECYGFWKEDFGPTYYAFDYKDCHFLVLNTEEERIDGRGPVWEAMMTFAEKDLATHQDSRHTFVFFHKPMWEDPRYEKDWARLAKALAGRAHTVVAGHEHYQSSARHNGGHYVIQSATGGGIHLSDVKEYGCFHSTGFVTVDGEKVTYSLVEPEGGIWPVDIAPASFRHAVGFELLTLDAARWEQLDVHTASVEATLAFHNTLPEAAVVRATVTPIDECGWSLTAGEETIEVPLKRGERATKRLTFEVPLDRLDTPPNVAYDVKYRGEWLTREALNMVQENVIPIYPADSTKIIPEWHLIGPFALGNIDTSHLPDDPASANPNFYKRFGPEGGYDPDRVYEGGKRWFDTDNQGRGLLNFNALMGTEDHALGYALCGVFSPEEQRVHATVFADNFSQVVLNGELVDEGQDFGAPGGFVYAPLELKKGWNTLIVKLINNRGDWFLRVLLSDPNDNLRFARHPE